MILLPMVLGSALAAPIAPAPAADQALTPLSALAPALLQEAEEGPDGTWHGNVNVGLSKSEGNADVESYSLDARAVREFEQNRYTLEALWLLSRDNERGAGESAFLQRRALGSVKYDQFLDEKLYALVTGLAETNFRAAVDLRWTLGAGLGYQFRDDDNWRINTEFGLSYFNEEFDNGDEFEYVSARFAWDVWTRISKNLVFGHFGEVFPSLDDKDDFYGRATTYFESQLTESMIARFSWLLTFDNTPAEDPDNPPARLQRADNVYLLTVGWTF
ncbi:MAG: DUF481 domain-containing protein [Planctomycetota bacterium]|nr:DUF481 domain-containing protein [Planctomycetota bacterium]MEC8512206.1 DUF481 domain-containing protein [Planctomycetota bacterium]